MPRRRSHLLLAVASTFLMAAAFSQEPYAEAQRVLGIDNPELEKPNAAFDYATLYPYENPYPVTSTTRLGESVSDFDVNVTAPLYVSEFGDFVLFGNAVFNRRDTGEESYSIGLGARWLIDEINSIVGFRVNGDVTDTVFNNQLSQIGLGVDVFTAAGISFHANYYIPTTDDKLAREFRDTQREVQRTRRQTSSTTFGNPYATGNSVVQEVTVTSQVLERTTVTEVSRLFQQIEAGRQGGDLRAVIDLPIFKRMLVQGTVGAYHYQGSVPGSSDLGGLMAAVSMSPVRGVRIGAEYYDDEEVFGSNWVGTVGVSVPLDFETLLNPARWGEGIAAAFSQPTIAPNVSASDYLQSKMLSTAPRNNRVLAEVSSPIEDVSEREVSVTSTERVIARRNSTQLKTIADDLIFVNNGGAVGNGIQAGVLGGAGTAENPTNSINEGANLVQTALGGTGTVYVQAANSYGEEVVVDASGTNVASGVTPVARLTPAATTDITFTSSFKGIDSCGGLVFGGNTARADVAGGFYVRGVERARISAFNVTGGLTFNPPDPPTSGNQNGAAIVGADVNNFIVDCNITDTTRNGIAAFAENSDTSLIQIFDNQILGTTNGASEFDGSGILVRTQGSATVASAQVFDNIIDSTERTGIYFRSDNTSGIASGFINGNTISNTGNAAAGLFGGGVRVFANANSNVALSSVNGNTMSLIEGQGVSAVTTSQATLAIDAIDGNTIADTTSTVNQGNGNSSNNGDGIFVQATTNNGGAGSNLTVSSISGNTLTNIDIDNAPFGNNAASDGIELRLENSGGGEGNSTMTIGAVDNNVITNVASEGIDVLLLNGRNEVASRDIGVMNVASISGNTVTNTDATGIRVIGGASGVVGGVTDRIAAGTLTVGDISGNTIADGGADANVTGGDALEILGRENALVVVGNITGNTIDNGNVAVRGIDINLADGLLLQPAYASTITTGLVTGNTILNTNDRGINIEVQDNSTAVGIGVTVAGVTGNTLTSIGAGGAGEEGIRLLSDDFAGQIAIGAAGIANNIISTVDGEGIIVLARDATRITIPTITGNIVSGTVFEGFEANSQQTSTILISDFSNNSFTGVGDANRGVFLRSQQTSTLTANGFDGNTIDGAGYNTGIQLQESNTSIFTINGTVSNTVTAGSNGAGNNLVDTAGTILGTGISVNGGAPSNADQ